MPAEFLTDLAALASHLTAHAVPFRKSDDGSALLVAVQMIPGVVAPAIIRWGERPRTRVFECATLLPIPVSPDNRPALAAALHTVNRTLPASAFVLSDAGLFHVANAFLNADGSLSSKIADLAIAVTRVACDRHFGTLLGAATGRRDLPSTPRPAPRPAPIVTHAPFVLTDDQLTRLAAAVAAARPSFSARLSRPVLVEEIKNPWFNRHKVLSVQSPAPMPAAAITVCLTPDGDIIVLSGHPAALTTIARAEPVALSSADAARAYANVTASWTRAADFPELPIATFDDIPFRPNTDAATISALRVGGVAAHITAATFTPHASGWRLDVWLVSAQRLVHRLVTVERDGALTILDDVVIPDLPVHPGRAWGMVNGRLVPVG